MVKNELDDFASIEARNQNNSVTKTIARLIETFLAGWCLTGQFGELALLHSNALPCQTMGCGASQDLVDNDEVDLIHRICILIENKHPSAETIWELLKKLPNRDRKLWKGCWSTPLGNRPI